MVTVNGKRLTPNSQGFKILSHIIENDGASKYSCVTNVLGRVGSRQQLRGYYSDYFLGLVTSGVLSLDKKTHIYKITGRGLHRYLLAGKR